MKKLTTLSITLCLCIIVHAQTTGAYRTIASGNWTNIAIWQRYNGAGWKAATVYPTYTDGAVNIRDGHNVITDLNLTIDQLVVDGGGQLILTSNYTITLNNGLDDDLIINGLFYMTTGAVTGTGRTILNNEMRWNGGALQTKTTNTGTIAINGGFCALYGALANSGTINWTGGRLAFYGGSITNNGDFNAYSNDYLNNQTGGGIFTNNASGVFNVNVIGNLINQINFINKGVINFNSGNFLNHGSFTNTKTLNFDNGLFQNEATTNFNKGTKITGTGWLTLYSNTLYVNTPVTIPSGIIVQLHAGSPTVTGTGSLNLSGNLWWYRGTISLPITVNASGVVKINYDNVVLNSSLTNNGTVDWNWGHIYFAANGSIINNKAFNITNDFQLINNPSGSFTNNASGTVTKSSFGTTTINIPFSNKGTITGTGTFNFGANLTNVGTFDPGAGNNTAILTTGTNYTNSDLSIKIKGLSPGQEYDRLAVNGDATLKGTLTVTNIGNVPAGADTILTTTGTISGKFNSVQLPPGYSIIYKTNRVIIKIPANISSRQNENKSEENLLQSNASNKQFSVFPNPVKEYLHANFQVKNKNAGIIIFNENGKMVYEGKINPDSKTGINVSRLIPGTYLLQLRDGDKTQSTKFIKQ